MTPQKILFSGDIHGNFEHIEWLTEVAQKERAEAIFVLGDFGIWDHMDEGDFQDRCSKSADESGIPVYFLPGNHENYDLLEWYEEDSPRDEDGFVILREGVLYSPRAHRWIWHGVRFLSLGGAYSVDKAFRVEGDERDVRRAITRHQSGYPLSPIDRYAVTHTQLSWWHQEEITEDDRDRAMKGGEVDVMLTHDKPRASNPQWNRKDLPSCWPNQQMIQDVVEVTQPSLLLHGHLHHPYGEVLPSTGTVVRAFDCDPYASETGQRDLSYGIMTFLTEDAPGYTMGWYKPHHKMSGARVGEWETILHKFRGCSNGR